MWFPRPADEADVVVPEGAHLGRGVIVGWLRDPRAEEWRHKVGVAGSLEGSAKPSTRLLHLEGWVLKTRVDEAGPREAQLARLERLMHVARAGIWHPAKQFFLLRYDGAWLVASACPRLDTVRAIVDPERRLAAFASALAWSLSVSRSVGLGLDPNPSNFGIDPAAPRGVRYLDDETYPPLGPREIGEAIAGRLPEDDLGPDVLERVGREIARAVTPVFRSGEDWAGLLRGLDDYPLVPACEPRRQALRARIKEHVPARRASRSPPRLTCVLADVHANLPALDAVLTAARAAGADSWLVLGDVVGYGPHPSACLARIAELAPAVLLRGNHDLAVGSGEIDDTMNRMAREVVRWTIDALSAEERGWLAGLPVEHVADDWMAVHGAPRDPHRLYAYVYELTFRDNLEHLRGRRQRLCFYGHTHVPFVHRASPDAPAEKLGCRDVTLRDEDVLLVNPGSVGQPRDGDSRAAYLLWDRRSRRLTFQRVEYALDSTLRDLDRSGLPRDLAYRLETGR